MFLNDEGKKEFLKSKFHRYFDISINIGGANTNIFSEQFVNFVLLKETVRNYCNTIDIDLDTLLNEESNNIIFTPKESDEIYHYEFYKNVYFIRLKPFSKNIRMHIIPKKYNASDTKTNPILFFKDAKQTINDSNFSKTEEYERRDSSNINLYYKEDTEKISNGFYKFDIKDKTKGMTNLQINLGYSYNDTNPTNKIKHMTGIIDESDENGNRITPEEFTEYNITLIDINADNRLDHTNKIVQPNITSNEIDWDDLLEYQGGFDNSHPIETVFHKTLKYFNDDLYIEEGGQYHMVEWTERRE